MMRWLLLLCLVGCATPAEVIALGTHQRDAWREIRREGKAWSDAEWDAVTRANAAEAALLTEYLTHGTLAKGSAFAHLKAERAER